MTPYDNVSNFRTKTMLYSATWFSLEVWSTDPHASLLVLEYFAQHEHLYGLLEYNHIGLFRIKTI